MKWGGVHRTKFAWVPHKCYECEAYFLWTNFYHEKAYYRYCIPCDTERQLKANAAKR